MGKRHNPEEIVAKLRQVGCMELTAWLMAFSRGDFWVSTS
jgi:hypothetical protein